MIRNNTYLINLVPNSTTIKDYSVICVHQSTVSHKNSVRQAGTGPYCTVLYCTVLYCTLSHEASVREVGHGVIPDLWNRKRRIITFSIANTREVSLQHYQVQSVLSRNYSCIYLFFSVFIYYFWMEQMAMFLMPPCCPTYRNKNKTFKKQFIYLLRFTALLHKN